MNKKEPRWLRNVKKNYLGIKNYDSRIDLAKYKLEKEWNVYQWMVGIAFIILLSVGIFDIVSSTNPLLSILGIVMYFVAFIILILVVLIHLLKVGENLQALTWLYQQRDKLNKKRD